MHVSWTGIYPALLTPFKEDDSIDFDLFKLNVHTQLDAGIEGMVIGGSLGEASTLTKPEIFSLVDFTKLHMSRRVPVVVTIAEQSTHEALRFVRGAEQAGADGFMILPPMRYKADDRETVEYFKTIARSTALPIMIYNNPHDYKIEVTLDMFKQLAEMPNIRAVKESTRDVTNVTRMRNAFGERFNILCGVDTLAYEELALGADGWVSGLGDAFPYETVAIYRLIRTGRFPEALDIYRWFMPALELDIHPKLVQYIKLAASLTGIGSEWVRAPRLTLEGEEKIKITKIIKSVIATRPELPDDMRVNKIKHVSA
jgi:1-pyrroline-4-hydroxy-2-carboxylate deaminase